jgi:hypothetical protein
MGILWEKTLKNEKFDPWGFQKKHQAVIVSYEIRKRLEICRYQLPETLSKISISV